MKWIPPEAARGYYESSLKEDKAPEPYFSSGSTPIEHPYTEQRNKLALASLIGLGAFSTGFIPTSRGSNTAGGIRPRMFDVYHKTRQIIEDISPAQILRTFQVSQFLAPLTSGSRAKREFSGAQLFEKNHNLRRFYERIFGSYAQEAWDFGVLFSDSRVTSRQTGEVLLDKAFVVKRGRFTEAYTCAIGVLGRGEDIFGGRGPDKTHILIGARAHFADLLFKRFNIQVGQKFRNIEANTRIVLNVMQAFGAESVQRYNRMLTEAFYMGYSGRPSSLIGGKLIGSTLRGISKVSFGLLKLHTDTPSTLLPMVSKLALKAGMFYGAIQGVRYLDYLLGEKTGFRPSYKIADTIAQGHLLTSRFFGDTLGLKEQAQHMEEIAPGSTGIGVAAIPLAFGLTAGIAGFAVGRSQWTSRALGRDIRKSVHSTEAAARRAAARTTSDNLSYYIKLMNRYNRYSSYKSRNIINDIEHESIPFFKKFINIAKEQMTGGPLMRQFTYKGLYLGALVASPFALLGVLPRVLSGGLKSTEDLEKEYQGEKMVPIRKGRWWELGRSPYEGEKIMYHVPNWYVRFKSDAEDINTYGSEAQKWAHQNPIFGILQSVFSKDITLKDALDPYYLEKKHYYDRPYPITGPIPWLEDIPFIGSSLSRTFGKIIKPPKYMHREEWQNEQGEYKHLETGFDSNINFELGDLPKGTPINPYDFRKTYEEQRYRMNELSGLLGFTSETLRESIVGPQGITQEPQMQSSYDIDNARKRFWEKEIGGLAFLSEIPRRMIPREETFNVEKWNPIRNLMPEWLPGPGDKSLDFLHGDPYAKIPRGDIRLPGAGYAALYPELENVDPQNYPLIHQYKILADVAPYSERLKQVQIQISTARKRKEITKQEIEEAKEIRRNLIEKKRSYTSFTPYVQPTEDSSFTDRFITNRWESIAHNLTTPLEYLTPASPSLKLLHAQSPIESYEQFQVYGTKSAFWDKPWSNFIRPFIYSTAHMFGYDEIPQHIQAQRDIEEYFDKLEYLKYRRLERLARIVKDMEAAEFFRDKVKTTMFGVNPYQGSPVSFFKAIPTSERSYFNEFLKTEDREDRQKILSLVPDYMKPIYQAQWDLKKMRNLLKEPERSEEDQQFLSNVFRNRKWEGYVPTDETFNQYREEGYYGSFADWQRTQELKKYFEDKPLPAESWVGYNPNVDLQDIKYKFIESAGGDIHDFNLWEPRGKNIALKPYINDEVVQQLRDQPTSNLETYSRIHDILMDYNADDLTINAVPGLTSDYNINIQMKRNYSDEEILKQKQEYLY